MTLRYGLLFFLALFVIILLSLKNYEIWTMPLPRLEENSPAQVQNPKPDASQSNPSPQSAQDEKAMLSSIVLISEKNPFHPDRKEFPIGSQESSETRKPVVRPQVTLYGVMIAGEYRSASISYPRTLRKGEREVFTVRVGDKVGDYQISKILEDRIGLEAPGDSFEVLLYDARAPKKRIEARTINRPTTIINTLTGEAKPETPPKEVAGATGKPTVPIQEKIIETPAPRPVSPALVPVPRTSTIPGTTTPITPRTRRWFGPKPPGED